ncbi:hypothetical protein B0H19DRAFT_1087997 [Mycena capillaripes]|nr:hypothetical protein B0H19DRAFT_1087997 [Mycena capillaripes]
MCTLRIVNLARLCSCCGMCLLWQKRYHLCAAGQIEARNYLSFDVAEPSFEKQEPRGPSPRGAGGGNTCHLTSFQFYFILYDRIRS